MQLMVDLGGTIEFNHVELVKENVMELWSP